MLYIQVRISQGRKFMKLTIIILKSSLYNARARLDNRLVSYPSIVFFLRYISAEVNSFPSPCIFPFFCFDGHCVFWSWFRYCCRRGGCRCRCSCWTPWKNLLRVAKMFWAFPNKFIGILFGIRFYFDFFFGYRLFISSFGYIFGYFFMLLQNPCSKNNSLQYKRNLYNWTFKISTKFSLVRNSFISLKFHLPSPKWIWASMRVAENAKKTNQIVPIVIVKSERRS